MADRQVWWKEAALIALFFIAGAQGARLYEHWHNGDLAYLMEGGFGDAGISFYLWLLAVLPLLVYGALRGIVRSPKVSVEISARASTKESSISTVSFYQIIEHLKAQEKELRDSNRQERERAERHEQFNEKIISSIESAFLTVDKDGAVSLFNPAAERLFKQRAEQVQQARYSEVFALSPQLAALIDGCLSKDLSYRRQEFNITDAEGHIRHVGAAVTPIKQSDGSTTGALCLITDLTEIVELQQQMRLRENLAALGEMSAGIAHEFKNALATIGGYAQLIAREAREGEILEYIQVIRTEVEALTQIIGNFLDFTKPGALVLEEIDLGQLVENGVRDLATESVFAHVNWEVTGTFERIRGDRVRLRQALQNILRNAAEAIPPNWPERRVWIHGRTESQGNSKQAVLEIEDTGTGLTEANLQKIFLPFFTTKSSGTGLGLAIVQKTIVHHNGKISASRRASGPGMRFTISLPAAGIE